MFSKACEYGIRATLFIASNSAKGLRVSLRDIAVNIDSPEAFTSKILQQLVHHDIIASVKGAGGGFEIPSGKIKDLRLSHIVMAVDGDSIFKGCVLGLPACTETNPCPAHSRFMAIRRDLREMLENTPVLHLAKSFGEGLTFLKMLSK